MRLLRLLLLTLLALPAGLRALDPRTGGTTLLETVDARAAALAETGAALTGDLSGAAFNPSVLTTLNGSQVLTQFAVAPGDVRTGLLGFGQGGERFGWSANLVYLDAGSIEVVPTAGTPRTIKAQQDFVGSLSGAVALTSWLRAGVTVKQLRSTLAEDYTANVTAGDGGILVDLPVTGLRLGATVQNVGGEIAYRSEGDPLPRFYRAGLSFARTFGWEGDRPREDLPWYEKFERGQTHLLFLADAIQDGFGQTSGSVGVELDYLHLAILRVGGRFGDEGEGFTGGVGFWITRLRLDYAIQMVDELSDRHRVTVSYFFGARP